MGKEWLYRLANCVGGVLWQIGFLTEWQLYAQKIEGDAWVGEKLDPGKIEKMSGMNFKITRSLISFLFLLGPIPSFIFVFPAPYEMRYTDAPDRPTDRTAIRADAGDKKATRGGRLGFMTYLQNSPLMKVNDDLVRQSSF